MSRVVDTLKIELIGDAKSEASGSIESKRGKVFDRFTSFQLINDLSQPSEAAFEVGDDGTWSSIEEFIALGAEYQVTLNGHLRLTGRIELSDIPLDPGAGAVVRFTVRTKLMDAQFASAEEKIKVRKTSIKDFILALYAQLGYDEDDFIWQGSVARDLLTGKDSKGQGNDSVDLEPIKVEEARVHPPESIYSAADRHLRRHGFMHWDSPDGKIVVGAPNDQQEPLYHLTMKRHEGQLNNCLSGTRSLDWSNIPSVVKLYGVGGKRGLAKTKIYASIVEQDVTDAGFRRPITVLAESIKTKAAAERAAKRELSARSKSKDAYAIEVDGLSWWNGSRGVPWGIDTVCRVESDVAGGAIGAYYLYRVVCNRNADQGDTSNLSLLKKGVWVL